MTEIYQNKNKNINLKMTLLNHLKILLSKNQEIDPKPTKFEYKRGKNM